MTLRLPPAALAALGWALAVAVSFVTLRRTLDPFDEGLLLQAATRIADGQWPYADFGLAYGPGHALLQSLLGELLGPSVAWWRALRAATDGAIALLAYQLVRDQGAPRGWAAAAGAVAALTMAQPTTANPFPLAFALGLGAVAVVAARRPAWIAGLLVALAGFWRPDFGFWALLAVVAATAADGRRRDALVSAAVAAGAGIVLYAPFAVAAGPGAMWDALVSSSLRDGAAWRLPFPFAYDGPLRPGHLLRDGKDLLGYQLPLLGVIGLAAAAAAVRRRPSPAALGVLALALGGLVYLVGRADDLHQQPLLVAVAILAAGQAPEARRLPAAILAAVLALAGLAGALNLVSAVLRPPAGERLFLPGVPGILVAPEEARALPALVRDVQRRVPPGEPIYVAPRRSDLVTLTDPLLHFLVRRPNVLGDDAQVLNDREEQEAVVAALRADPPRVVVRWTDPLSSRPEPNERGRPSGVRTLDAYLAEAYEPAARHGDYEVLTRR